MNGMEKIKDHKHSYKYSCLFLHYNQKGKIDAYVFTYLESLVKIGIQVYFISNSAIEEVSQVQLEKIIGPNRIFQRENKGIDFGAWKWALEQKIISEDTDYLLLTNDSVYGPFFSLTPIFESMESMPNIDFWGLTDNYQGGWHLQSYFLCLSKKVFIDDAFIKIFSQDFSQLNKLEIIRIGEIQLSKSLVDAGFKGAAYVPYSRVSPGFEEWDARNSTHFFWDSLIEKFHFPFVKRQLVLENPENIQNIEKLFQVIEKKGNYPVENIKQSISGFLDSFDYPADFPDRINVICHLYYPGSVYYFLTRLLPLKSSHTQFIFNLSASLYHNAFFCEMLRKYFPGAFILYTPNQGRDIGGKLAAFDIFMKAGIQTDFTLIIHDKQSPHTPTGIEWRNRLLRIISPDKISNVFRKFHQIADAGIISSEDLIKNEYDPDKEAFSCTSSNNLLSYIKKYKLNISDYRFAAGTIFWIRTSILLNFFSLYPPLSIRKGLETGNALDFDKGTNIHAWERLFSLVANSQGYKTIGI